MTVKWFKLNKQLNHNVLQTLYQQNQEGYLR